MGFPLYITSSFFFLTTFKILSLYLAVGILTMCLCVSLFGFILFGTLIMLRKFSAITSSNRFSVPFFFFWDPMMLCWYVWCCPLNYPHLNLFPLFDLLIGWFPLRCFPGRWVSILHHIFCCWFPPVYFSF